MDVRIALTGFGNVGQGLALLLRDHGEEYARQYGLGLVLAGVADRGGVVTDSEGLDPGSLLTAKREHGTVAATPDGQKVSAAQFLDAAHAAVLVEAASTNFEDAEPGWSYVQAALERSMDVVLASKGALVLHFDELMAAASQRDLHVRFAGTVGAPVPVLELASRALVGIPLEGFEGIVNATTNQILSSMEQGMTYEEGLRKAQEIGVAETDPTLDVDGWDAAAKAVIVARALFDARLELNEVRRTGIRGVTPQQLAVARERGNTIKLVARVSRTGAGVQATVAPEERSTSDVLGALGGQQMGVVLTTGLLGDVASTVQLTGGVPTALTVLRDLINLARDRGWSTQ